MANKFEKAKDDNVLKCPYCQSWDIEALQFDTDIEALVPVAYLPYICETCHKRWTMKLTAKFIRYDDKKE